MAQGATTKVKKRKPSVIKRARQSHVRAEINRANRTRVRTIMKRLRTAIAAKDGTTRGRGGAWGAEDGRGNCGGRARRR